MKSLLTPVCLLIVFCTAVLSDASVSAVEPESKALDLILVAGQSNAVGYDARPDELPKDAADQNVLFWWRCGDPPPDEHDSIGRKWSHLQPQPLGNPKKPRQGREYGNFAQPAGGFGPEMGIGRTLYAQTGSRLAIVKVAFSGTGLRTDWNPDDPGPGGSCYRALVQETRDAIAAASQQGVTLRVTAIAWVQGESDANANDAPKYEQRLGHMLTSLRRDLDASGMVAMLAVNTRFGSGKNEHLPTVIAAQQALAMADPLCDYVDTSKAGIANGVHFNAAGTLEVGRLFAVTLLRMQTTNNAGVSK
jgi:hypothetical protein